MLTTLQRRLLAVVPLALTTMASTAWGETYYVDFTGGDDVHTFVEAQNQTTPWKTWEAFQGTNGAAFQSGDRILFKRGETWKRSDYGDCFRPSAMDGVTFGAYGTGDRPKIDADNDTAHTDGMYVGYNGAATNILFEDIEFTNSVPKTTSGYLVTAHEASHHLTFRNCHFDATQMDTTIYADINETLSISSDYLTIDGCSFVGAPPYNRHAAYAGGQYARFINNYVKGFGVSGLKLNGDTCQYGTIAHNVIIDANVNIMLGESRYADVYGNISILTATAEGTSNHIRVEDDDGVDDQMPRNNKIYNNTFVGNGAANVIMVRSRKSGASFDAWDVHQDNEFRNNIWYLVNEDADFMTMLGEGASYPMPSDYSLFHSDGDFVWRNNGTDTTDLAAWQTSENAPPGFEEHSLVSTADDVFEQFVVDSEDPDDYRLSVDSIAIDSGQPVSSLTLNNGGTITDFFGNPYSTNDIGAIAFGSGEECEEAESCNGQDDDCDEQVDEDWPTLGDPCSAGVGECQASGQVVCATDGLDVICDAVPLPAGPEICDDGLDNDCDDEVDEDCDGAAVSDEDSGCGCRVGPGAPTASLWGLWGLCCLIGLSSRRRPKSPPRRRVRAARPREKGIDSI